MQSTGSPGGNRKSGELWSAAVADASASSCLSGTVGCWSIETAAAMQMTTGASSCPSRVWVQGDC